MKLGILFFLVVCVFLFILLVVCVFDEFEVNDLFLEVVLLEVFMFVLNLVLLDL